MDEEELTGREKTLKTFATLTLIFVVAAVIATLIDHGIKRQILDEAARARATLDEIKRVAAEVKNRGTQETRQDGAGDRGGVGADPGVVDDAGAGTVLDQAAGAGEPAAAVGAPGVAGGSPGNGRRAVRSRSVPLSGGVPAESGSRPPDPGA